MSLLSKLKHTLSAIDVPVGWIDSLGWLFDMGYRAEYHAVRERGTKGRKKGLFLRKILIFKNKYAKFAISWRKVHARILPFLSRFLTKASILPMGGFDVIARLPPFCVV